MEGALVTIDNAAIKSTGRKLKHTHATCGLPWSADGRMCLRSIQVKEQVANELQAWLEAMSQQEEGGVGFVGMQSHGGRDSGHRDGSLPARATAKIPPKASVVSISKGQCVKVPEPTESLPQRVRDAERRRRPRVSSGLGSGRWWRPRVISACCDVTRM